MCGIAGILRVHPPGQAPPPPHVAIPEAWLDILDESIRHRGPDGHGRFRDRAVRADGSVVDVAFVHRRLSIIDHAGGHQPMVLSGPSNRAPSASAGPGGPARGDADPEVRSGTAPGPVAGAPGSVGIPSGTDPEPYRRTLEHALRPCPRCAALGKGTVAVVFNGCIYNHRELRRELEGAGHEFSTDHSDTEVPVHGWGEWGLELPARLEAMASAAIWNGASAEGFLFRDRRGEKPLFYSHDERHTICVFGSTAGAVFRVLAGSADLASTVRSTWLSDPTRRASSLADWIASGGAGHLPLFDVLSLRHGDRFKLFWPQDGEPSGPGLQAWADETRPRRDRALDAERVEQLLERAVESRLEADVPLGVFLSGGVDSSLLALLAKRQLGRVATFTVRMPDRRYDESGQSADVAEAIGAEHQTLECAPAPASDLIALIQQAGIPFGDSSLLPAHWVSRASRAHVKVALTGDGGDESFAGYNRYQAAGLLAWSWPALALFPAGLLGQADPKSTWSKLARLIHASRADGYIDLSRVFPCSDVRRLMATEGPRRGPLARELAPPSAGIAHAIGVDIAHYLPDDLLRKTDTASMAVALEVRAPFLDRDLMDAALRAPIRNLMPRGQRKGLLRAVARKYFPPEIVDRPKMGFAIPIGEWFRSDYGQMRQLLLDHLNGPEPFGPDHLGINAMINMDFVRQMLREHDAAGEKSLWPWKGRDHSQRLYMLLVLSIWAKWLGSL